MAIAMVICIQCLENMGELKIERNIRQAESSVQTMTRQRVSLAFRMQDRTMPTHLCMQDTADWQARRGVTAQFIR